LSKTEFQAQVRSMFLINELIITAIRTAYAEGGELVAAVELRRHFPGISAEAAPACARSIAAMEPLGEIPPVPRRKARRRAA
jgi:hypothetical protein